MPLIVFPCMEEAVGELLFIAMPIKFASLLTVQVPVQSGPDPPMLLLDTVCPKPEVIDTAVTVEPLLPKLVMVLYMLLPVTVHGLPVPEIEIPVCVKL